MRLEYELGWGTDNALTRRLFWCYYQLRTKISGKHINSSLRQYIYLISCATLWALKWVKRGSSHIDTMPYMVYFCCSDDGTTDCAKLEKTSHLIVQRIMWKWWRERGKSIIELFRFHLTRGHIHDRPCKIVIFAEDMVAQYTILETEVINTVSCASFIISWWHYISIS